MPGGATVKNELLDSFQFPVPKHSVGNRKNITVKKTKMNLISNESIPKILS